jgi:hypothetical protein
MTSILLELDNTGDTRVEWDKSDPEGVEIARKAFATAKKKGKLIYKTRADGSKAEQLHEFDADAERIVASPALVGG